MSSAPPVTLALTVGDPAGIGPEICVGALSGGLLPEGVTPVLIGSEASLRAVRGSGPLELQRLQGAVSRADLQGSAFFFISVGGDAPPPLPGRPSAHSGRLSAMFLERAVELAGAGVVDGIVTAPISKEAWRLAGIPHPGHTQFLRAATGAERTGMMFEGGGLRVALYTIHVSLRQSITSLNEDSLVSFIRFVVAELAEYGLAGLRVAVAGLNPHAGEGGMFGDEEARIITPALRRCRDAGIDVSGPLPADSLFHEEARSAYDLVIAMHHDQGLIPVKTLDFYGAVNITLGLPFVRTSPGHGAAFDIAGRGIAKPDGIAAALSTAARLVRGAGRPA